MFLAAEKPDLTYQSDMTGRSNSRAGTRERPFRRISHEDLNRSENLQEETRRARTCCLLVFLGRFLIPLVPEE